MDKSISATKFRKAVTTHVRDKRPEMREDMAQLCCHSSETADRHYRLYNHQQKAISTAKVIKEVMESPKLDDKVENTHKRRAFNPDESQLLISLCEKNIKDDHLYKNEIKRTLDGTDEGRKLVEEMEKRFGENVWKKIVDRVRTESKQRKKRME